MSSIVITPKPNLLTFAPVQKVKEIASVRQDGSLENFLGENVAISERQKLNISRYVQFEILQICLPEDRHREEEANIHTFPLDDAQFYLQLLYLQLSESEPNKATVYSLVFLPSYFDQYPAEVLTANMPFRFDQVSELEFPFCSQTRILLDQLQELSSMPALIRSLKQNEIASQLLRRALQCATQQQTLSCHVPSCRFLAYETEREKITEARNILEQQLDRPITIRELSRKVAMNECYLKKGFKALTGRTINDYQQELRIAKAKELLQQDSQSVSYVAATLGYSSISHFSTAFKKATGMKPCELLS